MNMPALLQIKNKYILSPVKSGLMIIDQKRAHERILYEKFLKTIQIRHIHCPATTLSGKH
jgi:DNA mismatch repair protein MutL